MGLALTLLIDTRIETPDSDWVKEQNSQGFEVLHLPALEVESLNTILDWSGVEALFLASPRAVFLAQEDLKKFNGPIWAVGPGTAKALTKIGLKATEVGDSEGAFPFLENLQSRDAGTFPISVLAWVSAEETAVDLDFTATHFQLKIRHFPVYRTVFKKYDFSYMNSLSKPRKWLFYSGRAVESFASFISSDDDVLCIGKSAEQKYDELIKRN